MNKLYNYLLLLLCCCAHRVNSDYYSAVTSMQDLLTAEQFLINSFEKFVLSEDIKHLYMEDFLKFVEKNTNDANDNKVGYYGNPINAFKMVKRVTKDWRDLFDFNMKTKNEEEMTKDVKELQSDEFKWPERDDLLGATKGLARLQRIYKLPINEFANGTIMGRKVSTEMLASDCYSIGKNLADIKDYKQAIAWLLEARSRLNRELSTNANVFPILNDNVILDVLADVAINSENDKLAYILTREQLMRNPNHPVAKENWTKVYNKMYFDRKKLPKNTVTGIAAEKVRNTAKSTVPSKDQQQNITFEEDVEFSDIDDSILKGDGSASIKNKIMDTKPLTLTEMYEGACNGDIKPSPRAQRKLRCRYVHNNVPFNRIAPFKREELSLDPFVAVHYNVIYDSEIQKIIDFALTRMERSKVGLETKSSSVSDIRTSQQAWIHHHEPIIGSVLQRLRDLTGLTTETAEALQVANYGIGGHYAPHYDFGEDSFNYRGFGNRILTALFYINDIDLGGATAFPFLHLAVPPIKYSMVMWYNMHESLDVDYRTKHAGCPVLKGSKWICNEWFHERGQELLRPCSLTKQGDKSIQYKSIK